MTKEEILHLATLSRIKITDEEAEKLNTEIDSVLDYVSVVDDITADSDLTKKVGARFNIFREDEVTNKNGENTEVLLAEAPHTQGRHLKVKKVLNVE